MLSLQNSVAVQTLGLMVLTQKVLRCHRRRCVCELGRKEGYRAVKCVGVPWVSAWYLRHHTRALSTKSGAFSSTS